MFFLTHLVLSLYLVLGIRTLSYASNLVFSLITSTDFESLDNEFMLETSCSVKIYATLDLLQVSLAAKTGEGIKARETCNTW